MASAVLSCLGQSVRDIEVIVVDDATTDHTAEILEALQKYDDRLTVLRLPLQLGISGGLQRNEGLKVARGKYICYLDDDDVMTPWSVEKRVEVLEAHPELDFCWAKTMFVRNYMPGWEHDVYERLVPEFKVGNGVHWSVGTILPDEFMHRAGVVGAASNIWWTPGRGEDQRLLADIIAAGYKGAPVDTLAAIYGRGNAYSTTHVKDKAIRARLLAAEREKLKDAEVLVPGAVPRPQHAPTRLPSTFSDRMQARNRRELRAQEPRTASTERVMQGDAGGSPVPEVRRDDEEVHLREAAEVEM
jgi:glycosyltransferase involved in cell wall biosynthesis